MSRWGEDPKKYVIERTRLDDIWVWDGEDIDVETGVPHIICVAWHAFALAEFGDTHPEFDDRPRRFE